MRVGEVIDCHSKFIPLSVIAKATSGTYDGHMEDEHEDEVLAAWEAFVYAHATVMSRIERDLFDAGTISLTWYDVLVALSNAPEQRLRMGELAESLVLSRSGLTRLVDRIERAGLLQRVRSTDDRRGSVAVLTEAGMAAVEDTWPHYAKGVSQYFGRYLTVPERRALARGMAKVRDQNPEGA
jgi:DNA-binding MarR family transcriptional regulator